MLSSTDLMLSGTDLTGIPEWNDLELEFPVLRDLVNVHSVAVCLHGWDEIKHGKMQIHNASQEPQEKNPAVP